MLGDQEKRFIELLKEAEEYGSTLIVQGSVSSRELALSYTNLQQATLWAEKDSTLKADRIAQQAKLH